MNLGEPGRSPILEHGAADVPMFVPGNLLDGARRQKGLPPCVVPSGCLLDMDGELVERLVASGRAVLDRSWPCFHTKLYRWAVDGIEVGLIGGTVGAPFAVLVEPTALGISLDVPVSAARTPWVVFFEARHRTVSEHQESRRA
jgi:hypothetical protein